MSSQRHRKYTPQWTPRDFDILRGLFESRVMSSRHLAGLYFDGRVKAAAKRLRTLKAAGLIAERPRLPQQPAILYLTRKGYTLLRSEGQLAPYPDIGWAALRRRLTVSALTLRHELDVMDVKTAMVRALRDCPGLSLVQFTTWPRLFQFPARDSLSRKKLWMRPDGYLEVQELRNDRTTVTHRFYWEVDRSTEVLAVLRSKAACYLDHYRSGGMAARFNQPRDAYKRFPFRTLWIFRSAERRNNAAELLLLSRPPILTSAWLTTMAEFLHNPLAPVWLRPRDYRDTLAFSDRYSPTAHDTENQRNTRRDEMAERCPEKKPLWSERTA